jgi:death on curing protein
VISLKDVIKIHNILIERFGGINGIRDKGLLEAVINRSFSSFDGNDLYISVVDKSAA